MLRLTPTRQPWHGGVSCSRSFGVMRRAHAAVVRVHPSWRLRGVATMPLCMSCLQDRLKQALREEQGKRAEAELRRKRAEADLKHLQLQNPALGMHAMQHLIGSVDKVRLTCPGPRLVAHAHPRTLDAPRLSAALCRTCKD